VAGVDVKDALEHCCRGDSAGGIDGVEAVGEGGTLGGDTSPSELGTENCAGDADGGGLSG
jgi:hypothetical protein